MQDHRQASLERWLPLVLVVAITLAYAPVFGAEFLNYDDPWLFQHNPFYAPGRWNTPLAVFFDFSESTRLALGAEYLPVRDLLGWLETRAFGMSAAAMHAVSVGLYGVAVLLLRSALRGTLGPGLVAELAVLLFALHPIHVESVAWLSGQKDVLAMLFVAAALREHVQGNSSRARWLVPLFVLAASFSKAMSVAVIVLLWAQDFQLKRRPDGWLHGANVLVVVLAVAVHLHVGQIVGMVSEPAGGSRYAAVMTMGPVWLRYLGQCLLPLQLSVTYLVPDLTSWSVSGLAGYGFVAASLALAIFSARHGQRFYLFLWIWFFAPFLPVSQLGAPLQNRMADRYAWLSVLAPCLLVAWLLHAALTRGRLRLVCLTLMGLLPMGLVWLSFERSILFTDSVLLFADAAAKAPSDPKPMYHLGRSLSDAGQEPRAMLAFREALTRAGGSQVSEHRSAANGLARLLARHGRLSEAEQVLREARATFPRDPKLAHNLARLLRASNRADEAEQLELSVEPPPSRAPEDRREE